MLVTDGADPGLLETLRREAAERQVTVELVAPTVGGVQLDGTRTPDDQRVDGAPSVLAGALPLFEATGLGPLVDDGFVALDAPGAVGPFLERCAALRYWERQLVTA